METPPLGFSLYAKTFLLALPRKNDDANPYLSYSGCFEGEFRMRKISLILLTLCIATSAEAADKQWFVSVFGENLQPVTGASANNKITDGTFLDLAFVGKEIYVRSKEHYELDQFRQEKTNKSDRGSASAAGDAAAVASSSPEKVALTTEFGPLADTGLQYAINGDFRGWYCPQLFVKPLGDKTYRLRCETDMRHD